MATKDKEKLQTHPQRQQIFVNREIVDCTLTSLLIGSQLSRDHVETGILLVLNNVNLRLCKLVLVFLKKAPFLSFSCE